MKCPECKAWTFIHETRLKQDNTKRRRYECANGHRFTTLETVTMEKRNDKRIPLAG